METQKERLIQVRRRTPAEVWDKAIAEYLAGARASEVAAKYGVSAHSIYQRVSGRGKKKGALKGARVFRPASAADGSTEPAGGDAAHAGALGEASDAGLKTRAPLSGPAGAPAVHIAPLSALMLGPPPGEGPRISLLGPELAYRSGLSGR